MASATPAAQLLLTTGRSFTLHEYSQHEPGKDGGAGFGAEAAAALGIDPARMFKTLVVDAGGRLAVGVVPVAGMLDLKAMAAAIEAKNVRMADSADAERATGYVVGGISPLGQRKRLVTVVDTSASGWETVYISAGRRGLQVELEPGDLVELTAAIVAPIGRIA
jgi:Cys-tRNA(Pro)/Cys-tRNA(Cys) deacylase